MSALRISHSLVCLVFPPAALALLFASALALAACGGEAASGTTPAASSPSSVVSTSPPAPIEELTSDHHPDEGPPELFVVSDGVYRADAPGTASLAQTEAVARRYAASLGEAIAGETMPGAGLYAANATWDFWPIGRQVRGARNIARVYRESAYVNGGADASWSWSKRYHLLSAPGVAIYEGMFKGTLNSRPAPDLVLLVADGGKIAHQEVFIGGAGQPVTCYGSPPGPGDTAQVAAQVGAALGAAFATRDRAALQALLAPDVLFRDTTDRQGVRGRDALLTWWATVAPAKTLKIKSCPPIAGPGWAVVRWTARRFFKTGFLPNGVDESRNGATVIEVRDGRVVRMTLYLEPGEGGEWTILQEQYPN